MDNERKLPKQAFDSEYMTEFLREVRFLTDKGIKYTSVKKTRDYGISQYKYKKTPALFAALVEFYAVLEAEKNVRKKKLNKGGLVRYEDIPKPAGDDIISPAQIKKAQEILEKAVQQSLIKNSETNETEKFLPETIKTEKDDTI